MESRSTLLIAVQPEVLELVGCLDSVSVVTTSYPAAKRMDGHITTMDYVLVVADDNKVIVMAKLWSPSSGAFRYTTFGVALVP